MIVIASILIQFFIFYFMLKYHKVSLKQAVIAFILMALTYWIVSFIFKFFFLDVFKTINRILFSNIASLFGKNFFSLSAGLAVYELIKWAIVIWPAMFYLKDTSRKQVIIATLVAIFGGFLFTAVTIWLQSSFRMGGNPLM